MSAVSKFYSGRSVFITGGTGFIGKQMVEKLLRSCSEIDRIYLLMRPKKGMALEERLAQTLSAPVILGAFFLFFIDRPTKKNVRRTHSRVPPFVLDFRSSGSEAQPTQLVKLFF